MKVLCVHPSPLMYAKVFLRLELVAESLRHAGHEIRLMDMQVESLRDVFRELDARRPNAICFSLNYLANVLEIVDLAKAAETRLRDCCTFIGFIGGHSAFFVAKALLEHGEGLLDCVLRGDGEAAAPRLLEALANGDDPTSVPGADAD